MSQGRYDLNPYLGMGSQTQQVELGAWRVLSRWSGGLIPSGDGAHTPWLADIPVGPECVASWPVVHLEGYATVHVSFSSGWPSMAGGVIMGHLSPPVPAKLAWKIWRGEFMDLNHLLPHRLGAPEPTLANALQ